MYFKKHLSALPCTSICLLSLQLPIRHIFVEIDTGYFYMKVRQETPNLVKTGQKYVALYMKTYIYFIVVSDINSP